MTVIYRSDCTWLHEIKTTVLLCLIADNPPCLPGVDESKAYFSTTNPQYLDDAEDFLHSEVLSHYGDLLVSFK